MNLSKIIEGSLRDARACLDEFLSRELQSGSLEAFVRELVQTFRSGGKVLVAGNGGSMADAMHFAEEWTGRFRADREPYPVIALSDPTHLTCVGNDYGYQHVFSRPVRALARENDLVLLISTSGDSENLIRAAEEARRKGARVAGFLGRNGGRLAPLCDIVVLAPGETSDRIQEVQMAALHIAIEAAEAALGQPS